MDRRPRARRAGHPDRRGDRDHDRPPRAADRRPGADRRRGCRRRAPTDGEARRHRPDQRLRRAHPALRAGPAEGGGGEMSDTAAWNLALVIGLVAALIVAGLLILLIKAVREIEGSVNGLLDVATSVAENTANIPQLEATAPVLGLIVEEAIVQDGYMNALTDGYGGVRAA